MAALLKLKIGFFLIVVICVSNGMVLKGMAESSLLLKDECLTPNIDKVMAISILRKKGLAGSSSALFVKN